MAHGVAPAAVKTFDTSDFDDDSPTREYYLKGLERKVDTLGTAIHEERTARAQQMAAMVVAIDANTQATKRMESAIAQLATSIERAVKFTTDEREKRFELEDRVKELGQRPKRAGKRNEK